MEPSIGRIVHYLEGEGETRAAIITRVHESTPAKQRFLHRPDEAALDEHGTPTGEVVTHEPEPALDSDGDEIWDAGTDEGDVSLTVFRPDGSVFHVPCSKQTPEDAPDDAEGDELPAPEPGEWSWPPRI